MVCIDCKCFLDLFYSLNAVIILTLWYHDILCSRGFARTEHSKYTSSPSLMSCGLSVLPKDRETTGGSATKICTKQLKCNLNINDMKKCNIIFFLKVRIYVYKTTFCLGKRLVESVSRVFSYLQRDLKI